MKRLMVVIIFKFILYFVLSFFVVFGDLYMFCKNEIMYLYFFFVNNSVVFVIVDVVNKFCRFNCGGKSWNFL